MQVGSARASLHIEDLHLVGRVVFKDIARLAANDLLLETGSKLRLHIHSGAILIMLSENIVKCRVSPVDIHIAGTEVDRSGHRTVDTAEVNDQLAVHVQPEIVVTGELIDDIVPPVVKTIRRLDKPGFQFHGKIVIRIFDQIQLLVLARVAVRQRMSLRVVQVLAVDRRKDTRLDAVVRVELAMLERRSAAPVIGTQFLVDIEVASVKVRKVLRTVELEITGRVIGTLNEQMVDFLVSCVHL